MLSSDYGEHPVAYAMNEVVCLHDASRFDNYLYATTNSAYNSERSPLRQKFRRCATEFRDVTNLDFAKTAETICGDGVHLLFDLNGYSTGARSEVFTFRPALIQFSGIGYPDTLGALRSSCNRRAVVLLSGI